MIFKKKVTSRVYVNSLLILGLLLFVLVIIVQSIYKDGIILYLGFIPVQFLFLIPTTYLIAMFIKCLSIIPGQIKIDDTGLEIGSQQVPWDGIKHVSFTSGLRRDFLDTIIEVETNGSNL